MGMTNVPYEVHPADLETALAGFVAYYNFRRYHQALGDVTPAGVLEGKREQVLQRRREVQTLTILEHRRFNSTARELTQDAHPT